MAIQKNDPFGHAPLVRSNSAAITLQDKPLTRPERHSIIEYRQQVRAEEMTLRKTEIGQAATGALHLTDAVHFTSLLGNLDVMKESFQGSKWAQGLHATYIEGAAQQGGAYINIATRTGSEQIIAVIGEPLYKPTKEEEPGLAQRFEEWLFGT
jgi:hypothetical protein